MPNLPKNTRNVELATVRRNHLTGGYPLYGGYRILPKDDLLIEHGHSKSYDLYRDLLRDPHVHAVTQKRWLAVVGRDWKVKPASERKVDKKAAELIERQLKAIGSYGELGEKKELTPTLFSGFDQVCYNLLKGEFYGFQPAEVIWGTDGKETYPRQIKSKSPRRFAYLAGEKAYLFRLLTPENPYQGEALPTKKFVIHTYNPEDDNPYGWGVANRLFYPVMFKRELARFSLIYADKFGSPTGKATYPKGREDIKDNLLEAMDSIAQEAGIAIEEGTQFDWIAPPGGVGVNIYTDLMDYFDREISKAVLGETGSTDQQGSGGSRARDQIGNEVRIEIAKASADLLSETLNRTLLKWMTWYNFGDRANPPTVWREFPELEEKEDLGGRAQRDNTLSTMMELKPTRKYVEETYSIEFQDPEPEDGGLSKELGGIFGTGDSEPSPPPKEEEAEEATEFSEVKKTIQWNGYTIALTKIPSKKGHGIGYFQKHKDNKGNPLKCLIHRNAIAGNERYKSLYRFSDTFLLGYSSKANASKAYLSVMGKNASVRLVDPSELKQYRKEANPERRSEIGQITDRAIEMALPEIDGMRSRINREVQRINKLAIDDNAKYAQLQESLYSLYSELDADKYGEILGEAIALAEFVGRFETSD